MKAHCKFECAASAPVAALLVLAPAALVASPMIDDAHDRVQTTFRL